MFGEVALEEIIVTAGYLGIFGLMIVNGFLSYFPSSQILYIISGYFVFTGDLNLFIVTALGALGNTIGNFLLFYLVREKGLAYINRFTIVPQEEIRKLQIVFEKRGTWFLFIGKLLPAIKVFMPIVAGIAKMKTAVFIPIILVSSYIWSLMFVGIGYFFGKSTDFFGTYALVLLIFALILVGALYRYMNSSSILKELKSRSNN